MARLIDVQSAQRSWAERNFPPEALLAPWPLHGAGEELREFSQALATGDRLDALADAGIFLLHFCTLSNFWLVDCLGRDIERDLHYVMGECSRFANRTSAEGMSLHLFKRFSLVETAALKLVQGGLRGATINALKECVAEFWLTLAAAAYVVGDGVSFTDLVLDTWAKVAKRDWKANPETGRADG